MEVAPNYERAVSVVREHHKASPSLIQRMLKVPYTQAMEWIARMEAEGICGRPNSAGLRRLTETI